MIRPFTCLCLAAACGSGLYLYSEKHRTAMLDRDISNVIHQTEAARARIGLLRAEWALLNEPGRLQDMADKYLALKPMAPTQFVQISDLAAHLPPPEAARTASAEATDDDSDSAMPQTPTQPITSPAAPDAPPATGADDQTVVVLPPKRTADPKPDARGASKLLAAADSKPKPVHHTSPADHAYVPPHDGMMAQGMPLPLAAPQPVGAHVYSALAQKLPPAAHPQVVAAAPRYVTPYVASALGGRPSLPPPTPYGGDQ
jgi:hypothetical protein